MTAIRPITREDVTPELARRSGFKGIVDLLKVAQHGRGRNIYLVDFRVSRRRGALTSALTESETRA